MGNIKNKNMNMKNTKTKIILSVVIFLSVIGFVGTVDAAGASLYVSPAALTKTAGNAFSVSVGLNASGNKVCAVEGTLVFNNLTCQSIAVASDVMAQSSPTCSNPYFLIGIPNCTTSDKALLTVSVKAGSAGTASISPAGVDIIGEGASVGSTSTSGNYTINAIPKPVTTTPETNNDGFVGYVNGKLQTFPTLEAAQQAGATGIEPNYERNPAEVIPASEQTEQAETPIQEAVQENDLTAAIGTASLASAGMKWYNYSAIALAVIVVLYGIYYFVIKRKKK